jgi:RHS repeat-associated protein
MSMPFAAFSRRILILLLSLLGFAAPAGAQRHILTPRSKTGNTRKAKTAATASGYEVLYSFCSASNCTDGESPVAGLIRDAAGNLYGTTPQGGTGSNNDGGTVFKVDTTGHETVLYNFCSASNCTDGEQPQAGLIRDASGNLYGTTEYGGANGAGTVFKVDATGHETVLYSFCSECTNGANPVAGLIQDASGNLYGTTEYGGPYAAGTVFKVDTTGHETVLYSFCPSGCSGDGKNPLAGLVQDVAGNLYGTTYDGGANDVGTVFKVDTAGHETVLYSFCSASNCTDGEYPYAGLMQDAAGNLYGTTAGGGASNNGTVFEVDIAGHETALYSFCSASNCTDGAIPKAGLIQDAMGNLYGTTTGGGANGYGTVFKVESAGNETVLYSFCSAFSCEDGTIPLAGLTEDSTGNLYGTTLGGGANGFGTVFELATGVSVNPLGKTLGDCGCATPNTVGQAGVGYPITVGTGNMFEQVADYATAGQNPLSFTRYYNSLASTIYGTTFATTLGVNWRGTYDSYLHITPATGQATSVTAERADGQVISFTFNGSGWTTDTDVDATLTQSGSTWTLKDHNDTVFSYTGLSTGEGLLNSITLRNGYTRDLTYSGNQLKSVTDSYDRQLGFSYYSNGMLKTVTTPDTPVLTYGFTAATGGNQLTSVSYNTKPVTGQTYVYGNSALPFALTGIIDENNNRFATWTYNSLGQGLTSQHGTGTSTADLTTLTYNGNGTTTVTNAFGVADTYTFSTLQNVPKATQISRAATKTTAAATRTFNYDTNGFLNHETDWDGNITTYQNNAQGNPTQINYAVGSSQAYTVTITYDTTFIRLPHQIVTPGLTSTFVYDGSGNVKSRTDLDTTTNTVPYSTNGQQRVFQYTWSSTGQELSVQLPRTDVKAITKFGYNGGTLISITDALGHETKITQYTGGGLPNTVTDPNNVTTTLTYDLRLNLHTSTLHTGAGNLVTTWTYDPANNLQSLQLPDNSHLTYGYDTAHRLTSIADLFGNTTSYTLDALGDKKLTQVTNPSNDTTWKHSGIFDALGRVTSDIGGMGQTTKYSYDPESNILTITPPPPSGKITQTFDALNRLSTVKDPSPGGTTTYMYDAHNRVLSEEDANSNTTSYVYDGFGDKTETASPDSRTSVFYYDPDRNPTKSVLPGSLIANSSYDALDRNLTVKYTGDKKLNVSNTYDQTTGHGFGIGRLTSAVDQPGTLSLTYDERGNITNEIRTVTGVGTLNTSTTFDAASNVASITYPSTTLVTYTRDSMGRVTAVTAKPPGASKASNVVTGVTYESLPEFAATGSAPVTGLSFGNGVTGTYNYDLAYRPTTRVDAGKASVQNLTYGYFANDSVKTITDAVDASNSQTLAYDTLDRLKIATSGTGGYGAFAFTWDKVSNVKTDTVNGTETVYTYTAHTNRLASFKTGTTEETIATTPAGNIATFKIGSTDEETLVYNKANQVASSTSTSQMANYEYDLTGQRLEKSLPGENPILYQFSRTGGGLLAENDLHKGQTADYIYLNGKPIGEVNPTNGKLYFTHTDRLGTPQTLTDSTQAVAWHTTYQPFGATNLITGPLVVQSLRLPGQQFDPESGFNHNGFRDYTPTLTRYLQTDPIGLLGGFNTYVYAEANPARYVDASGTQDAYPFQTDLLSPGPSDPTESDLQNLVQNLETKMEGVTQQQVNEMRIQPCRLQVLRELEQNLSEGLATISGVTGAGAVLLNIFAIEVAVPLDITSLAFGVGSFATYPTVGGALDTVLGAGAGHLGKPGEIYTLISPFISYLPPFVPEAQ